MSSKVPTVRYKTTIYAEALRSGQISVENYAVNNAIKVVNGSLESVLHLIGYSFRQIQQINRQFAIKYIPGQSSEFDLSYSDQQISTDFKLKRPTRAHIVECEDRLYGVVVDEGLPRICGQIQTIIPKTNDIRNSKPAMKRGLRLTLRAGLEELGSDLEGRQLVESGRHLVVVSQNGSLFVEPKNQINENRYENDLTLILGHGFVVIDEPQEVAVHWIRTKQILKTESRVSTPLSANQSIVMSFGAIRIADNHINVYGNGSFVDIKHIRESYLPLQ